jgi:N6-L-threonylcarbamoyladenine synthase
MSFDINFMLILGIETSCDETSVAILKDKQILSLKTFSQIDLHKLYGGVVPEIASRSHLQEITKTTKEAFLEAGLNIEDIDKIAVTNTPGLIGGLLVGINFALGLSAAFGKELVFVNHLEGHIFTCGLTSGVERDFFCLLISGGHTMTLEVNDLNNYKIIGKTIDDSVGESFDKLSKTLGFGYPGGAIIEKMAQKGDENRFKLKIPLKGKDAYNFSFSGLKTHFLNLTLKYKEEQDVFDICASFQKIVCDTMIDRMKNAINHSENTFKNLVICGGVSANLYIRKRFEQEFDEFKIHYAPLNLCTDNAVMIANIGRMRFAAG